MRPTSAGQLTSDAWLLFSFFFVGGVINFGGSRPWILWSLEPPEQLYVPSVFASRHQRLFYSNGALLIAPTISRSSARNETSKRRSVPGTGAASPPPTATLPRGQQRLEAKCSVPDSRARCCAAMAEFLRFSPAMLCSETGNKSKVPVPGVVQNLTCVWCWHGPLLKLPTKVTSPPQNGTSLLQVLLVQRYNWESLSDDVTTQFPSPQGADAAAAAEDDRGRRRFSRGVRTRGGSTVPPPPEF